LTYNSGSTLVYNATVSPQGVEWPSGSGTGVPYNVTINATNGDLTTGAARTVKGNLTLNGSLTLGGDITVNGNWTDDVSISTFDQGTNNYVIFGSTGTSTINVMTAGDVESFTRLRVNKGTSVQLNADVDVISGPVGTVLDLASGSLDLNGNTLAMYGNGRNISASAGVSISGGSGSTLKLLGSTTVNNPNNLTTGANVVVSMSRNVTFAGTSVSPTINGTLRIESTSARILTNAPTYGTGATLIYNSGGTYNRGLEWSDTMDPGYPNHVQISNNTTLNLGYGGVGTAREIAGNLTIDNGSELSMNLTQMTAALTLDGAATINGTLTLSGLGGGDLAVNGDLTNNGTLNSNGRTITLGGSNQNIGGSGTWNGDASLVVDGSGTKTMNGNLTMGSVAIVSTLSGGSNTLTLTGAGNVLTGAGTFSYGTSTVVFFGSSAQNVPAKTFYNLTINKSGATATAASGVTVQNLLRVQAGTYAAASDYADVQIDSGATLAPTADVTVSGNWTKNVNYTHNNHKVTFDGSAAQSVTGSNSFFDLTIASPGGVSTAAVVTVANDLSITSGQFSPFYNSSFKNVSISSGATLASPASGTLTVSGNFTNGGTFTPNSGTLTFNGTTQDLTLNVATPFNNMTVNSALLEQKGSATATVNGTLTNNGTIRRTLATGLAGSYTFGLTGVTINVDTLGTLSQVQVDRTDSSAPEATTPNMQTGRYWDITLTGAPTQIDVTLPFGFANSSTKGCRWINGPGDGWDCGQASDNTFVGNTSVTRNDYADGVWDEDPYANRWAVGNAVGPTVIQLRSLTASSARNTWLPVALLVIALVLGSGGLILARKRR
jgi:hypothetical protein